MAKKRVLVIDDDTGVRFGIGEFLSARGYTVIEAATFPVAEEACRAQSPDAILLDFQLGEGTALDLLPRLRAIEPSAPVVVLTAYASIERAVQVIQAGADQFFTKPVEMPALLTVLERLLEDRRMRRTQSASRTRTSASAHDPFAGTSAAIRALAEDARRALATDSPVLILGETGVGKGVLANWLHRNGPRADEAFVDLNCAGFSRELLDSELFGHEKGAFTGAATSKPGLLEVAHHGTVFLDEVGDMDSAVQAKLLKVLEEKRFRRVGEVREREVDIQLVAATHQDLATLVQDGRFRRDLYYRLNVIPLRVPALRERPEDIPLLARRLLAGFAAEFGRPDVTLSADAERALATDAWPGNVRELRNVIERALLHCDGGTIELRHLPPKERLATNAGSDDLALTLEQVERRHIERVLEAEGGHVERAAVRLGIPRSSLYGRLKRYQDTSS